MATTTTKFMIPSRPSPFHSSRSLTLFLLVVLILISILFTFSHAEISSSTPSLQQLPRIQPKVQQQQQPQHPTTRRRPNIRDRKHRIDVWDVLTRYLNILKKNNHDQPHEQVVNHQKLQKSSSSPRRITIQQEEEEEESLADGQRLKFSQLSQLLKLRNGEESNSLQTSQACQKCLDVCIREKRGPVCYGNCASRPYCRFEDISLAPNLLNHD
ncbi:hypothetical protein C9374_007468 [Naegleria lovaniensis]|uniref:Uncharacterized protein n=1 Tax=Naegleria lovaniensis TaxID=51637 RepID=A0AA88GH63_NAELO|nr:uncharacterized protein C9374_007468 [Naegleria lovaniensis]KAG2379329.1 hypothetical protein C9374_007468 [Naegleria lovaniensis]